MRILTLTNLYPPAALGGYELSCADVMDRFGERGHEVTVLTTDARLREGVAHRRPAPDLTVLRELRWFWRDHDIVRPGRLGAARIDRHNRTALDRAVALARPDVVSVWAMGAMSLSLLDRIAAHRLPAVWVVCDEWPVYGPRVDPRGGRPGAPTPGGATVCWVSGWLRETVVAATGWRPAAEVVTGSGVDERDFPLRDVTARPWRGRLLVVGRVEPRKGFADAVRTLALLPAGTTLRVAGPDDGRHADALRALARELGVGDRVSIGPVDRRELAEVYADADAVLFPTAWDEPFGLVPLEAMRCGTPVVAVASGGSAEYLADGENSLLVPRGKPDAMADACRTLAGDPALRLRLAGGGRRTAADRTAGRLADVLEAAHREAVNACR